MLFGLGFEQVFVLRALAQRLSWRSDVASSSDTNTDSAPFSRNLFFLYFDNFSGSSEGFVCLCQ